MIVTLDGQRLERDFEPGLKLASLVDVVRSHFIPERLIVSISVNGESRSNQSLNATLDDELSAGDQVDFESAGVRETAAEALRCVAQNTRELGDKALDIATELSTSTPTVGLQNIAGLIEGWQLCNQTLGQVTTLVDFDVFGHQFRGQSTTEHLNLLASRLQLMREALEARDLVSLVDVLRYEIPDRCEVWAALLEDLSQKIESETGA